MERHNGKAPLRLQNAFGSLQSALEFAQLIINRYAQRLEGARGGMDFLRVAAENAFGDAGKIAGPRDRSPRDDSARDGFGAFLFAVSAQDIGECIFRERIDQIGSGLALVLVHAHAERPISAEGKAARTLIKLK